MHESKPTRVARQRPPLCKSEDCFDEDTAAGKRALLAKRSANYRQKNSRSGHTDEATLQGYLLKTQDTIGDEANDSDNVFDNFDESKADPEGSSQNQNKPQKRGPLFDRLWRYLKQTWTGVMTGNEPAIEEIELPHRYRPDDMNLLCQVTGFSVGEMKRIYRGFKTECPTGLITEETFNGIYSRFFPLGAPFLWEDSSGKIKYSYRPINMKLSKKEKKELQTSTPTYNYSHYIFSTLDHEDTGIITFEDFVIGLSVLVRGTLEEKLRWMFSLYDQDRNGYISRQEMEDVVASVFDLMGKTSDPQSDEVIVNRRVDQMFQKMDLNGDGLVSLEEFLMACTEDDNISKSVIAFSDVHL